MNLRTALFLGLSSLTLLGGCATSQDLDLSPPVARKVQANGKEVFIVVTDRRVFEEKPSAHTSPSLDPDKPQDDGTKSRTVGRKRERHGKVLSNLMLKEGQTVEKLMTYTIGQAFVGKGYRVIERKEDVTPNTLIVNATLDKFWSWYQPWANIVTTSISTDVPLQPGKVINASITLPVPHTSPEVRHWSQAIDKALRVYLENLKAKLD